ncbi:type III polyketide synthase [Virgibacillus sp. W0181]|uniref:type III polyketide synthase n=1 Tax=Virgibacillus sp. W0181 TaxID=3391581 RepID=UPI003F44A15F
MAYISSVGLGIPDYKMKQQQVKQLVQKIFPSMNREVDKLMPVFDNAMINERQFAANADWLQKDHDFKEKNDLYLQVAKNKSLEATDHCLTNEELLSKDIPYEAVDMLMFISSTGIATPSLDAHLITERDFREDVIRMPLWGLGCAGGAIGLSRASEWIRANKSKTALVICCELCSLTFQKDDKSMGNLVGTALFGDGIAAVLLIGEESKYVEHQKYQVPKIIKSSSFTKKNSIDIMGWDVRNSGFAVIFSKRIPGLVKTIWKEHLFRFFKEEKIDPSMFSTYIAHPGGTKVLEAMEAVLSVSKHQFIHSYDVLRNHGNMSSATVFYVLYEWLTAQAKTQSKSPSIISALGPGFSSELALVEWGE